jgi:hypothetical protein
VISGSVSRENVARRRTVVVASRLNVGSTRKSSLRSSSRAAVVSKTRSELRIAVCSWPRRSLSASKTTPVLRTTWRTALSCELRTSSSSVVSRANGSRLPSVSEMSRARPSMACDCDCIHTWKRRRVSGSKARKISSSSTVGEIRPVDSAPSSGTKPARRALPGVSST